MDAMPDVWPFGDGEPACCGGSAELLCVLAVAGGSASVSGDALYDRRNWLEHLHGCRECERRQPCRVGRYLIRGVAGSMVREESLPEWMMAAVSDPAGP
jgi:hypothetical protein